MNPKKVMRLMNTTIVAWIELGKPHRFHIVCPNCGGDVECHENNLIFSARCRWCGEEI